MSSPPVKYARYFDFTTFASLNPEKPLPGGSVDTELNRVKSTTDQTIDRLALIQRNDGFLQNAIVTADSLAPDLSIGFQVAVTWTSGINYTAGNTVWQGTGFYLCNVDHFSAADWASDQGPTNNYWTLLVDMNSSAHDAANSATAAHTSELNAAASATAAAGSATTATNQATSATNSATAANTSKNNAATSETNAAASATAADASKTAAAGSATAAAGSATNAANSASVAASYSTYPNLIINGDFAIDQRTAGLGINCSIGNAGGYFMDRFRCYCRLTSGPITATVQRYTPNGPFAYAAKYGVTNGGVIPDVSDYFGIRHVVEGYVFRDALWGFPGAKPVTLSFWAYTSLAGQYTVQFGNSAQNRSYLATFNLPANVWTQIIITVPGDTAGVWNQTTGVGLSLWWDLGSGSNYYAPAANVWAANNLWSFAGNKFICGTTGNQFLLANVKLEYGSNATGFVSDDFVVSLNKCRRYFQRIDYSNNHWILTAGSFDTQSAGTGFTLPNPMRAAPTITLPPAGLGAGQMAFFTTTGGTPPTVGVHTVAIISNCAFRLAANGYTGACGSQGLAVTLSTGGGPAAFLFDAEL
jgi:hypothetical protein